VFPISESALLNFQQDIDSTDRELQNCMDLLEAQCKSPLNSHYRILICLDRTEEFKALWQSIDNAIKPVYQIAGQSSKMDEFIQSK
jgi:hypothetical protein